MVNGERKTGKLGLGACFALGVFLFALVVRLVGIGWGLKNDLHNASYHPDEPVVFGFSRAIQPERGQFVPEAPILNFYSYGTLYLTLLRVASDMTSTYTGGPKVKGDGFSWSNPYLTDWDWVSRCHLAGRLINAAAGAGTALMIFLLLRRFIGLIAAGAGGMMLALAPAHVVQSRFQTVDVLATFFLSVSFYYASLICFRPRESDDENASARVSVMKLAILAGVFSGLSAGTKYTGILATLSIVTALVLNDRKKWLLPALAACGSACLVFALTTPGVVLDTGHFIEGVRYEMIHSETGHGLVFTGTPNGFLYTITNLLFGIGPLPVVLGIAGLGYAAYRKHRWALVLLAFFIPYYVLISRAEVKFLRYSFPLFIGVSAGFGYLVQVSHRKGGLVRLGVGLGILGLGGVPFGGLATTILMTKSMVDEDPRDQAARYLKTQQGNVGYPNAPWFWSAPLFPDSADPASVPIQAKLLLAETQAHPPIIVSLDDSGHVIPWDRKLMTTLSPSFITYSSFESFPIDRLVGKKNLGVQQGEADNAAAFLQGLPDRYVQDRMFGNPVLGGNYPYMLPEDLFYTTPVIYVWKKKQ